jgi:hypothetical protein
MFIQNEEGEEVEIRELSNNEVYDIKMKLCEVEDIIPPLQELLVSAYKSGNKEILEDLDNIFAIESDILQMIDDKIFRCSIDESSKGIIEYTVLDHFNVEYKAFLKQPNYKDIQLFQELLNTDIMNDKQVNLLRYVDIIMLRKFENDTDMNFNIEKSLRLPIVLRYQYLLKKKKMNTSMDSLKEKNLAK